MVVGPFVPVVPVGPAEPVVPVASLFQRRNTLAPHISRIAYRGY